MLKIAYGHVIECFINSLKQSLKCVILCARKVELGNGEGKRDISIFLVTFDLIMFSLFSTFG
jgi:hypothetical protein